VQNPGVWPVRCRDCCLHGRHFSRLPDRFGPFPPRVAREPRPTSESEERAASGTLAAVGSKRGLSRTLRCLGMAPATNVCFGATWETGSCGWSWPRPCKNAARGPAMVGFGWPAGRSAVRVSLGARAGCWGRLEGRR
jgi:hypothetical protein